MSAKSITILQGPSRFRLLFGTQQPDYKKTWLPMSAEWLKVSIKKLYRNIPRHLLLYDIISVMWYEVAIEDL